MLATILLFAASVVAQSSSPAVVCVAGQCLQGYSNTSIGATLSAPGAAASLLLLPGQYSSTTNPQLLHNVLTSSSASLSPSPGFSNSSSVSLPLNIAVQPGLITYSNTLFAGNPSFVPLPSTPISNSSSNVGSIALSSNVWAAVSNNNNRIVLWNSVPDITQLPSGSSSSSLSILDIQSSSCSPPCSSSGVCSVNGTCTCKPGFTGTSCESCASGFFGPSCLPCPTNCTSCDQGISGSGRCLTPVVANAPSTCNCLNGACGSNGQCVCNAGWTAGTNGTACAKCLPGYFLTTDGNCQICQLGCTQCADGTGDCTACQSGFTQDANDRTKCDAVQATTSSGTICPDGSFSNGTACAPCSPTCTTCKGLTSNDCIICGAGTFTFNGSCVGTDANGVCSGTGGLIANNNNHECDTCGAKCTSCAIPGFNVASTINQRQCTGCLPGFVLSQGQCIQNCPSGTFLSPKDNLTCTACDSSCGTCAGSATFCLTCANNQLASEGKCVSACPSNTFSSSGSCIPCHPDCATCSGASFNQCSSCSAGRPVLTSGRCLATCSQNQYFDKTSSTCQSCDSSCSSCSGAGPSNCLSCSSSSQVLRAGTCASATCSGSSSVIPGLGLCLSDLVSVPQPSGTNTPAPLPSITGLTTPTTVTTTGRALTWWEILLMALGCAFILLLFLMYWRRRARRARAQRTREFAQAKALDRPLGWRGRLVRFGERLFGGSAKRRDLEAGGEREDVKLMRLRNAEDERHHREMEKIAEAYSHSSPSPLPSLHSRRLSGESLYSHITGNARRAPEPRQPVRSERGHAEPRSRFSGTTVSIYSKYLNHEEPRTEAEAYAMTVRHQPPTKGSYWMENTLTGGSKNPFRK